MNKILAIIGSGHLGQQIANYAITDKHYSSVVFFDDFEKKSEVNGYKIIGKIDEIVQAFKNNLFHELIIGIGYKHLVFKERIFKELDNKIPFGTIIHSSAWIDPSAIVGKGSVIYPCCCIDAKAVVESNVLINLNCTIAHDTIIGAHSFLSPSVALAGFVKIGEQCFLGINSTIIDNVQIAPKTQIGGAAVVIKNIENNGLYVGNPAKFVK